MVIVIIGARFVTRIHREKTKKEGGTWDVGHFCCSIWGGGGGGYGDGFVN
jgi:hypothetical protein